jgi:hypothetical protein
MVAADGGTENSGRRLGDVMEIIIPLVWVLFLLFLAWEDFGQFVLKIGRWLQKF